MKFVSQTLRKARDIVSEPVGDVSADTIQSAIGELAVNKINVSQKGANNGLATLDANGKVPKSQIPMETDADSILELIKTVDGAGSGLDADLLDGMSSGEFVFVNKISDSVTSTSTTNVSSSKATKTAMDKANSAHSLITSNDTSYKSTFEKLASRNKVNGYAGLDSGGKLNPNQIPGQTIVNVKTYASIAARNADTSNGKGDMAIVEVSGRADLYILKNEPAGSATTNADWLTLQSNVTIDVQSFNGRTGAVMPAKGDYTTELILHDGGQLDVELAAIEDSIPRTAGDLNAYTKPEADAKFVDSLSDSVTSTSSSVGASSKAAKTAYDRGTSALNTANGKLSQAIADTLYLGITDTATDSAKLGNKVPSAYFLATNLSSSVASSSEVNAATSKAAKTAYDKGVEGLNKANTKLDANATAVDSAKLGGKLPADYFLKSGLSSVVNSTSEVNAATSKGLKTAYDKAVEALNSAGGKVPNNRTVTVSNGLTGGGALSANITITGVNATTSAKGVVQLNSAVNSTSTTLAANSQAAKTAYDKGVEALNKANTKLDKTAKAADADKLDGQDSPYYRNAGNLNAGFLPGVRNSKYRIITASATLNHGDECLVDLTSASAITLTLPASPQPGYYVSVMDAAAMADSKTLILSGNGKNIMGLPDDVSFDVRGYKADYIYLNETRGWVTPIQGVKEEVTPVLNSEELTATEGQTVFDLKQIKYLPGYKDLMVSINGVTQPMKADAYTENSTSRITFSEPLMAGDTVQGTIFRTDKGEAAFTVYSEFHTATAGQTTFDLTQIKYRLGYQDLTVYINGVAQSRNLNIYTEVLGGNQVIMSEGLVTGDQVTFTIIRMN